MYGGSPSTVVVQEVYNRSLFDLVTSVVWSDMGACYRVSVWWFLSGLTWCTWITEGTPWVFARRKQKTEDNHWQNGVVSFEFYRCLECDEPSYLVHLVYLVIGSRQATRVVLENQTMEKECHIYSWIMFRLEEWVVIYFTLTWSTCPTSFTFIMKKI